MKNEVAEVAKLVCCDGRKEGGWSKVLFIDNNDGKNSVTRFSVFFSVFHFFLSPSFLGLFFIIFIPSPLFLVRFVSYPFLHFAFQSSISSLTRLSFLTSHPPLFTCFPHCTPYLPSSTVITPPLPSIPLLLPSPPLPLSFPSFPHPPPLRDPGKVS